MKNPHFVDIEEIAPGVWASPNEREKVRAATPAIGVNKARPHTLEDIPNAGSPAAFWAMCICCFLALYFLRG